MVSNNGESYILVDLSKRFSQTLGPKSVFICLKKMENQLDYPICLKLDSVYGFTHGVVASGGVADQADFVRGFFIHDQTIVTVIEPDQLVTVKTEFQTGAIHEVA